MEDKATSSFQFYWLDGALVRSLKTQTLQCQLQLSGKERGFEQFVLGITWFWVQIGINKHEKFSLRRPKLPKFALSLKKFTSADLLQIAWENSYNYLLIIFITLLPLPIIFSTNWYIILVSCSSLLHLWRTTK